LALSKRYARHNQALNSPTLAADHLGFKTPHATAQRKLQDYSARSSAMTMSRRQFKFIEFKFMELTTASNIITPEQKGDGKGLVASGSDGKRTAGKVRRGTVAAFEGPPRSWK
jgi:hypothetical protein